jgi:hypothetical protein
VDYGFQELGPEGQSRETQYLRVTSNSENAEFLHGISKSKSFTSIHASPDEAQAQALADKLKFIFGERTGEVNIQVKNKFFDTLIGDTIDISRTRMPGFDYDSESEQTKRIVITSIERSLRGVSLRGDDQKGVEDNSGSF